MEPRILEQLSLHWRSHCGDYNVNITNECLSNIIGLACQFYPLETGTSLVGSYSKDGYTANILGITPLPTDSKHGKFAFNRGVFGLKKFYQELWSTKKWFYLGEWHSHPEMQPIPSIQDDTTQFEITQDFETRCSESILLILGGEFFQSPNIKLFLYSTHSDKRIELSPKL
ncbi:Mov34/MPN/PAD-1 family protein [Candidatus Uabimicrobium sp. HlEnr_7]|uniref:Mov34/MPN/PAD-1 family protein n=1 Tax=Candidatus Uabimicrobium helgolandensis TaxID=3095367 RepID=UPI003556A2AB